MTRRFAKACDAVRALGGKPCILRIPAGEYVFDERLEHQRFDAHPMVNTATMFVEMDEVLPLFVEHGTRTVFADLSCAGVE